MRKMEEDHQADMKIHEERVKVRMEEFERLKMLQQEQIHSADKRGHINIGG